ncbi:UNVERIFIED_CONTAM: hypothetical protein GTU68_035158 [Idotea baltica]|nr:hypothetical protein [Idotea baltica]
MYEKFGSHLITVDGQKGTYFAVWAPSANQVSVIGDFNFWTDGEHKLNVRWDGSGIWEGFIPGIKQGETYKYKIHSNNYGIQTEKADPFALSCEHPPKTASVVWDFNYKWKDKDWMGYRKDKNALDKPYSVYEVHLASWKRKMEENRSLTYLELADELVAYLKEMQFTHVEFMPIMEYPYDPSWGYQLTGYFAPTSRFGEPEGLMLLVDRLHQNDIGVILDWVPSHFPEDAHGLGFFDGSHLYEHPDRKRGYHPDWKSLIFNYGRNEVKSFLISNALFWLDKFHADGLRVDAVASMLYLDYSRDEENLEAIDFIKELNRAVYENYPDTQTIAEESTNFTGVSKPIDLGGLGFGMKWMMGWMHDTLEYFQKEGIYRRHHQNDITFSMTYAFSENFMLPLSHDEVVYGKKSIKGRMTGDEWQQYANLRLLYGYMFTHPGTNLIFMGSEFGQSEEWNFQGSLDWHLLQYDFHSGVKNYVADLNVLYKSMPALYEKQFSSEGFEWIDHSDAENSVLSYIRKGHDEENDLVVICNMTPVIRENYKVGLPRKGSLNEIFNSDSKKYEGSGVLNEKSIKIKKSSWHNKLYSTTINLPPLGVIVLKWD